MGSSGSRHRASGAGRRAGRYACGRRPGPCGGRGVHARGGVAEDQLPVGVVVGGHGHLPPSSRGDRGPRGGDGLVVDPARLHPAVVAHATGQDQCSCERDAAQTDVRARAMVLFPRCAFVVAVHAGCGRCGARGVPLRAPPHSLVLRTGCFSSARHSEFASRSGHVLDVFEHAECVRFRQVVRQAARAPRRSR